jgi:hypothetical protein
MESIEMNMFDIEMDSRKDLLVSVLIHIYISRHHQRIVDVHMNLLGFDDPPEKN